MKPYDLAALLAACKCVIPECGVAIYSLGFCRAHYYEVRYHYATEFMRTRFWEKVEKTAGCWYWRGRLDNQGYGRVKIRQRQSAAHRVAWQLERGDVPDGLVLDHLCRNPAHLEPVTSAENTRRGHAARRSQCG